MYPQLSLVNTRFSTTASGLLSALYDMPPTLSPDDPVITKLDDFDKFLMHAVYPGTYLVEFFTWMKYLPAALAPWKRKANEQFTEFSKFFLKLLRDVEKQMVCATSLCCSYLDNDIYSCPRAKVMRSPAWYATPFGSENDSA